MDATRGEERIVDTNVAAPDQLENGLTIDDPNDNSAA
jgi:hypothetical protein